METNSSMKSVYNRDIHYRYLREKNEMSLCMAFITSNFLYLAADSRSSFVQRKNKISGMPCKMGIVTDDFKKIFKVPRFEIYGYSTGQNMYFFHGKQCSLPEVIPLIDFSSCKTLWDFSYKIWETLKPEVVSSDDPTHIRLFQYIDSDLYGSEIDFGENENFAVKVMMHMQPIKGTDYTYIINGSPWLDAISRSYDFPLFADDEEHIVEFIKKYFSDMKRISDIISGGIGGTTHILKIPPFCEYKWIEGGYDL